MDLELKDLKPDELNKKLEEINKIIQYLSETIETFSKFYRKDIEERYVFIEKLIDETLKIINLNIQKYNVKIKNKLNIKMKFMFIKII